MSRITNFSIGLRKLFASTKHRMDEVAKRAGVTASSLWSYKLGRSRPSLKALHGLTSALPVETSRELIAAHLLDETPEPLRKELRIQWLASGAPASLPASDEEQSAHRLKEQTPVYGVARPLNAEERVDVAEDELRLVLEWMRHQATTDPSYRKWLIDTYHIMQ
ncbi:MAG: helix-turn-helix transcriptional regulator [Verrucomicrobia bacterium]|nr:helix-turn-helix transcriptional regulator [Verrucomicrobiota bacterium]